MKKAKDVDEYIANAPKETQGKLRELRSAIRSAAPKATERISYAIPYYDYNGRLVYFALFTKHIGLYMPGSILKEFKSELGDYKKTAATVHLPLNNKLPIPLIKKLVKARIKKIDATKKK